MAGSLATGCAYNIRREYPPVDYTSGSLDKSLEEYEGKYGVTPESKKIKILRQYFTDEAFQQLACIPVVEGDVGERTLARATGRNCLMNLGQLFVGYGWGKKTIVKRAESLTHRTTIHEYVHHASAVGRIDDCAFEDAWDKMSEDKKYLSVMKDIDAEVDDGVSAFLAFFFPRIRTIEREAHLAEEIACGLEVPDYMKEVFKKTLRFDALKL